MSNQDLIDIYLINNKGIFNEDQLKVLSFHYGQCLKIIIFGFRNLLSNIDSIN